MLKIPESRHTAEKRCPRGQVADLILLPRRSGRRPRWGHIFFLFLPPPRPVPLGTPPFITHKIFQILRDPIEGELCTLQARRDTVVTRYDGVLEQSACPVLIVQKVSYFNCVSTHFMIILDFCRKTLYNAC